MGATPTQSATLRPCTIRGPCPDTRESVELRRLGDLKGANPNRISSSGHGCPDRQRLDQRPWLVLAERHCTMVNCNPNCNLAHDSWAQLVAVFKIAIVDVEDRGHRAGHNRSTSTELPASIHSSRHQGDAPSSTVAESTCAG